ncbi:glycine--tRNA ligase subunit beta [Pseudothermotoga thermarum]|uniref:Glycine--tRNA ligase beta subunit n=1 Tax=Pseudothermotoga thermarum DSM 5069 TaxID=688269 RepID=F7YYB4_9THEM|nr:glycine--tRNA ligase subunit beta [Pseudothermotoga thermarum]AEH50935.1 glycyl-tRNA synthetase beta chain [Pseudothermotoga thermarum DSM 5069]
MSRHMALLEIGVEEMPASEIENLLQQLSSLSQQKLKEERLTFSNIRCYATNRRFAIIIEDLAEKQEKVLVQKRGPSESVAYSQGQPTQALIGFLKANNATEKDVLIKDGYVYLCKEIEGQSTEAILPKIFKDILSNLNFSKPMRWGDGSFEFVRPVKWVVALYDEKVLPLQIFGKTASNATRAHPYFDRFVQITHPADYVNLLRENFVLVDENERIEKIKQQIEEIERTHQLTCDKDEALIKEISKIAEYPIAIVGQFDEKYLSLPEELITVTIKHHLRAFTTYKDGKISSIFVAFADRPGGNMTKVVEGYKNVVNARLEDARYYFEIDIKKDFEYFNNKLKGMVFQKELGTLYDKVERIVKLSEYICEKVKLQHLKEPIVRAAKLSKFDIASHVVFEFPELQGTMGRIYALMKGESKEIAMAIEEQYSLRPKTTIAGVIGLADRVDTIVGNICIGNIPSGSKDPFGLRSKAETIYWLIEFNRWDLNLKDLLNYSCELLSISCTSNSFEEFFSLRFYSYMVNNGVRYDVARAVNHLWTTPLRGILAANAIMNIVDRKDFTDLAIAFERVHNITKNHTSRHYDGALFTEDAERELLNNFLKAKSEVTKFLEKLDYDKALQSLIALKPYIDKYFDDVFVMVDREDIRQNRLGFLKNIDDLFMLLGDLSQLVKTQ